jgi:hypothetical protein
MFDSRVLKSIFQHKRGDEKAGWRKFHDMQFHNLCSLTNTRIFKPRKMRWVEILTHMGERKNA